MNAPEKSADSVDTSPRTMHSMFLQASRRIEDSARSTANAQQTKPDSYALDLSAQFGCRALELLNPAIEPAEPTQIEGEALRVIGLYEEAGYMNNTLAACVRAENRRYVAPEKINEIVSRARKMHQQGVAVPGDTNSRYRNARAYYGGYEEEDPTYVGACTRHLYALAQASIKMIAPNSYSTAVTLARSVLVSKDAGLFQREAATMIADRIANIRIGRNPAREEAEKIADLATELERRTREVARDIAYAPDGASFDITEILRRMSFDEPSSNNF